MYCIVGSYTSTGTVCTLFTDVQKIAIEAKQQHASTQTWRLRTANGNASRLVTFLTHMNGKTLVVGIMGFSLLGTAVIAAPVLMNLDAVLDGGKIQDMLLDGQQTWNKVARQLVGGRNPSAEQGGDNGKR